MKSMRAANVLAGMLALLGSGLHMSPLGSKLPFGGGHSYGGGRKSRTIRSDKNSDLVKARQKRLRKAKRRMSNHNRQVNQAYAK